MRQKHYFCSPNRIIMKKIFLTLAIAATMVACGQQGDKTQQQAEQNPQKLLFLQECLRHLFLNQSIQTPVSPRIPTLLHKTRTSLY